MDRANIVLQMKTYISSFGSFFPLISNTPNPSLILTCILCNGQINFTEIQNYNKKNYAVCMSDMNPFLANRQQKYIYTRIVRCLLIKPRKKLWSEFSKFILEGDFERRFALSKWRIEIAKVPKTSRNEIVIELIRRERENPYIWNYLR